jgi:aminoglycoside phosphotransferase (APT) family kinase protein
LGPLVVYRFMVGEMWNRRKPTPAELSQLAALWLQIHALPTADLWLSRGQERSWTEIARSFRHAFVLYRDWAAAEFPAGQRAALLCLQLLESRQALAQELLALPTVLCFSRADSRFANIIRRPDGRLGLVDWEDSGLRDPARDLADLLTHSNQEDLLTLAEWQPFLQPYLAAQQAIDPDLWRRTHLYLAAFPLFWLSIILPAGVKRAQAGKLAGWQANSLPINQRLRRYLARAMAWPRLESGAELEQLGDLPFFP